MNYKISIILVSLVIIALLLPLHFSKMFAMEEPEYLVFEGQSDSWKVVIEVHQSKKNIYQYHVSERHELKYVGEQVAVTHRRYPVEWRMDSVLSTKELSNRVSDFSEILGTEKGGTTMETNASNRVADIDDEFHVDVSWADSMNEQITLKCVKWK